MSKRCATFVAVAALAAICGLVWSAQSQQSVAHSPEAELLRVQLKVELHMLLDEYGQDHPKVRALKKRLELVDKALAEMAPSSVGRFALAASAQGAVKLDTKTGESWLLRAGKAETDEASWVPIKGGDTLPSPTPVPAAK
jgi:hypothetical protein